MGTCTKRRRATDYGAITLYGRAFNPIRLTHRFITPAGPVGTRTTRPTTPRPQPPTGITRPRFSHHPLSLATTHGISFPAGTEMFHFPAYPPAKTGDRPQQRPGCPIRKPSDQSPLGGSPRPIAARHVLHRSRAPRHPPQAPKDSHTRPPPASNEKPDDTSSLTITKRSQQQTGEHQPPNKGRRQPAKSTAETNPKTRGRPPLASTIQFSTDHTPHQPRNQPHRRNRRRRGADHEVAVREPKSMPTPLHKTMKESFHTRTRTTPTQPTGGKPAIRDKHRQTGGKKTP